MSDDPKKKAEAEGYEFIEEKGNEVDIPVPADRRPPDQLCIINLEVQFYDDEDGGTRDERKSFIRQLAEELHDRLMKLGRGWQRHSCQYRSLEVEGDLSLVSQALQDADNAEPPKEPIAGKLTILH